MAPLSPRSQAAAPLMMFDCCIVFVAEYQVNPAVRTPTLGPVIPQPDLVDLRIPLGGSPQKPLGEVFELLTPLTGIRTEVLIEI